MFIERFLSLELEYRDKRHKNYIEEAKSLIDNTKCLWKLFYELSMLIARFQGLRDYTEQDPLVPIRDDSELTLLTVLRKDLCVCLLDKYSELERKSEKLVRLISTGQKKESLDILNLLKDTNTTDNEESSLFTNGSFLYSKTEYIIGLLESLETYSGSFESVNSLVGIILFFGENENSDLWVKVSQHTISLITSILHSGQNLESSSHLLYRIFKLKLSMSMLNDANVWVFSYYQQRLEKLEHKFLDIHSNLALHHEEVSEGLSEVMSIYFSSSMIDWRKKTSVLVKSKELMTMYLWAEKKLND